MVGYLNNPKATAETVDQDGWLRTGDICYCDKKTKKWYIVDRKKVYRSVYRYFLYAGKTNNEPHRN